jgi:hypothetical protein
MTAIKIKAPSRGWPKRRLLDFGNGIFVTVRNSPQMDIARDYSIASLAANA